MERRLGHPATRAVAQAKKRGFCPALAAYGGGHIALCTPAPRKPGVSIHGHPLGGTKRCFA
jgi:hypothetical protein